MPTGTKLFLILSAALLPLAIIAMYATLQTTRIADQEMRARLRVAASEASRALAIELIGDMTALRVTLNALEGDPADSPSCARVQGVFAQQAAAGARFEIEDASGNRLCGTDIRLPASRPTAENGRVAATILPDNGLLLTIAGDRRRSRATAFFPVAMLRDLAEPSGFVPAYGAELHRDGEQRLFLQTLDPTDGPDRRDTLALGLGIDDLTLSMSIRSAPITASVIVALLLPWLMWAAAAGIGWFVVDRLLIRPLRRLRSVVGAYEPGTALPDIDYGVVPAQEIGDLGDTFRDITRTVQQHESNLAEGLVRQTKLTREVHHRVKNNLQVIASLINFHSRSAQEPAAVHAYASIQRRVDALAAVHRHHYAEMEENRGLELRAVVGELASNIRATAPEGTRRIGITLDVEPLLVSQDVAVAISFLLTELIELAMAVAADAQIRVSMRAVPGTASAVLRTSSPALVGSADFEHLVATRYGRVLTGLSRQLRSVLHHDPLAGAYEITVSAKIAD